jgi:hypothetical protein
MADVYDATAVVYDGHTADCNKVALCHRPGLADSLGAIEPAWQAGAENIGVGGDVASLDAAFVNSPGHFANIIGDYNRIGVGVVVRGDRMWVTFDFMRGPAVATRVTPPSTPVTAAGAPTTFTPSDPIRVLDTRSAVGARSAVDAGGVIPLDLNGATARPAGATGVALNVTVSAPSAAGYLTVYPCDRPRPNASNVNFAAGQTIPNLVDVALAHDGSVCIYSSTSAQVVADLSGWFVPGGTQASLTARSPVRVLDTRAGAGAPVQAITLPLGATVPASAVAVAMNVTVTAPAADGYLTVYPCGSPRPTASNVNYSAGETAPNFVTVRLGTNRSVCLWSSAPAHVLVDVAGWFGTSGGALTPVVPARLLDTRDGTGGWLGAMSGNQEVDLAVGGHNGVPAGATAVILNVTVTDEGSAGYLTVYPCGTARPTASNLNYVSGATRANLVTVQVGPSGSVCFYASSRTAVVADVAAYVTPA